jgi:hypothetical protein
VRQARREVTSGAKRLGVLLVTASLVVVLSSCFGHWLTPPIVAKLIVGPVVGTNGRYEVLISVADMPDGGVAGIQLGTVALPAIAFANVDVATIVAEGLSGFRVTAQSYTAGDPAKGCVIAVYGGAPIVSGSVLKLAFEAAVAPAVTLDDTRIWLTNDVPTWIAGWDLETGAEYYTKEAGAR